MTTATTAADGHCRSVHPAVCPCAPSLDDSRQQGCIVVVQDDCGRSRVHKMGGCCVGCGGRSCRLHRNAHIARRRLGGLRYLVLEHAMRLAASARLILPEARRGRARLFDLHVAHRAGAVVAFALCPQLAGLLMPKCRRLMAVLAVRPLFTCRIVKEVAIVQVPRKVHKWRMDQLPTRWLLPFRPKSNF